MDEAPSGVASETDEERKSVDAAAAHLAQVLMAAVLEPMPPWASPLEVTPPHSGTLAVVENDVASFGRQYQLHVVRRIPMPCLAPAGTQPVPVDLSSLIGQFWRPELFSRTELGPLHSKASQMLQEMGERSGMEYSDHDPHDVFAFFRAGLTRFLRPHISAERGRPQPTSRSPRTGYPLVVHTHGSGLRIFYSPAYWREMNTYFGGPTTPARGELDAGFWSFAADGDDLPLTLDTGVFEVPRVKEASLLRV